jgi:hypothetical protein
MYSLEEKPSKRKLLIANSLWLKPQVAYTTVVLSYKPPSQHRLEARRARLEETSLKLARTVASLPRSFASLKPPATTSAAGVRAWHGAFQA